MKICLAGKTNALKEAIDFTLQYLPKDQLWVLPAESDPEEDYWQYSIKKYAQNQNLKVASLTELYPEKDLIFISIQYDKIIAPNKFFSDKLYNIHFSFLPEYKGVYPTIWPLLNNAAYSGVSLHLIDAGIDTGDIIDQIKVPIQLEDTSWNLYEKCLQAASFLFRKNFFQLISNGADAVPQSFLASSYYSKKSIDFSSLPINLRSTALQLHNQIRAFSFRPYQMPEVLGFKIAKSEILPEKSIMRPGRIIEENEECLVISTIDFNLKLVKDYFNDLIKYCRSGDTKKAKETIPLTTNLEDRAEKDWTPLMIAAYKENLELVEALVENGANVNARTFKGTTPLMYAKSAAKKSGRTDIMDYLILNGALVNIKDSTGTSIYKYALQEGNKEVIKFFKGRGAKESF